MRSTSATTITKPALHRFPAGLGACAAVALAAALSIPAESHAAEGGYDVTTTSYPTLSMTLGAQTVPVGVRVKITERRGSQTRTESMTCVLAAGVRSKVLSCAGYEPIPVSFRTLPNGKVVTAVPLVELHDRLLSDGFQVTDLESSDPPVNALPAEGVWVGFGPFGWWDCELEDSDYSACASTCGGSDNIESLTTEPQTPSNNPFFEPACETRCECVNGLVTETLDPPQTAGLGG